MRWLQAEALIAGTQQGYDTWFSPYLVIVRRFVLETGLGYASYHFAWVMLLFGTWTYAVSQLFATARARLWAHTALLLPFLGGNFVLQSADGWVTAGGLLLIGALAQLFTPRSDRALPLLGLIPLGVGAFVFFGARFNSFMILPFVIVLPLFFWESSLRWRLLACGVLGGAGILPKLLLAFVETRPAYKQEASMAWEIVGVWKEARVTHPDEAPPELFSVIPDPEAFLEAWHADYSRLLMWRFDFFRSFVINQHSELIRRDYFSTIRRFPKEFVIMRAKIMAASWGFTPPRARTVFEGPPPDEWMDTLKLGIYHDPLWPWAFRWHFRYLVATQDFWAAIARPWIWWSVTIFLTVGILWRRQADALDLAILTLTSTYFATLLLFSAQYIPRYNYLIWSLLFLLGVRLSARLRPVGRIPA